MYTNTGGVVGPGSTVPDDTSIELLIPEDVLGIGTGSDILIVDDSDTNLIAYEAALAPLGRRLVVAGSGIEALRELLDADFALVLLDFSMPGITGIETAKMVRSRPRSRGTPILFISGASPTSEAVLEAFKVGALDFISKPIHPEVLRAKVSVYLRLQERTAQLLKRDGVLRDADKQAPSAELRLEKLEEITTALGDTRTPEQVASVVVRSQCIGAGTAAGIWIANADRSLTLIASHSVPDRDLDAWRAIPPDADVPVMQVLRSAQPIWIENEDELARNPTLIVREAGRVRSLALLPLLGHGRAIGVVAFSHEGAHAFSTGDRRFLVALARATEQALERVRLCVAEAEGSAAAERANTRKDEFLAMLGHELRNPLAAIVTAVELVQLRSAGFEHETSILQRQTKRLARIIDDLLDVSRITRGIVNLQREAVGLRDAFDQACEMVQGELTRLGHQLSVDVPSDLLVDADQSRLVQVLFNLISNAVKYTPRGGRIEVAARSTRNVVSIIVRDNGRGIPSALLADVFELFVQGDRGLDRNEGGLGIGLTLVRTLVQLHGGTVSASSDGEGKGATFTVEWPRASSSTRRLRVLVVDRDLDAADRLAMLVEAMGHLVHVAHHSDRAIAIAAESVPDVVLLDVGGLYLDGDEVATRLRALPGCHDVILVAITGSGAPEEVSRSRRSGFAEHVVKPVEPSKLRSVLDTLTRDAD